MHLAKIKIFSFDSYHVEFCGIKHKLKYLSTDLVQVFENLLCGRINCLFCTVNTMDADALAMQGARASTTMVFT